LTDRLGLGDVRRLRAAGVLGVTLLVSLLPSRAHADETHACIVASEAGQQLRDDRKLVAASEKFGQCAREECPAPVRKACLRWLGDVETALPTVVPAARDAAGRDLSAVKVSVDGAVIATQLDGRPFPIDPGPHVLRFEPGGGAPVEERVIVREGERNRLIQVVVTPVASAALVSVPPTPISSQAPSSVPSGTRTVIPLAAWVLAGVGVAAIGSFAYFGLTGQSQRSTLETSCKIMETCNPSDVTAMRTNLVVADVSLGVGVAAVGAAVYFALARRARETPRPTAGSVDVGASPHGGLLRWRYSF
jgi:hypothetical protein